MQVFGFLKYNTVSMCPICISKCRVSISVQYVSDMDMTLVLKCLYFIGEMYAALRPYCEEDASTTPIHNRATLPMHQTIALLSTKHSTNFNNMYITSYDL